MAEMSAPVGYWLLVVRRGRIDDGRALRRLGRREAAQLGVLADRILVLGEVDAEGPLPGDVGVLPLHARSELCQCLVRLAGRAAQLAAVHLAHTRNCPLDHELA